MLLKAESIFQNERSNAFFVFCASTAVSCDAKFVIQILNDFFEEKVSFSAHTDYNHIMKNSRCQLIIRCNRAKIIRSTLIVIGLLQKSDTLVCL